MYYVDWDSKAKPKFVAAEMVSSAGHWFICDEAGAAKLLSTLDNVPTSDNLLSAQQWGNTSGYHCGNIGIKAMGNRIVFKPVGPADSVPKLIPDSCTVTVSNDHEWDSVAFWPTCFSNVGSMSRTWTVPGQTEFVWCFEQAVTANAVYIDIECSDYNSMNQPAVELLYQDTDGQWLTAATAVQFYVKLIGSDQVMAHVDFGSVEAKLFKIRITTHSSAGTQVFKSMHLFGPEGYAKTGTGDYAVVAWAANKVMAFSGSAVDFGTENLTDFNMVVNALQFNTEEPANVPI